VSGSSGKRGHRAAGWASVVVAGLVAVSIMLTAACATAGSAGVQAAGSQAPRPAVSSSGSVAMSPPQTPSSGATPPAGPERPCPGGTVTFVHHPGDPWSAHLCLRAGARLELTLLAARGYRWTIVESSDPAAATVTGGVIRPDGAAEATLQARRAGTVELTATTSFTGDPFGPPTRLWRLTLRITP
jgi:hypothetical protein